MITVKKGVNSTTTTFTGTIMALRDVLRNIFGVEPDDRVFVDGTERSNDFVVSDGMIITFQNRAMAVCEKGAVTIKFGSKQISDDYDGECLSDVLDDVEDFLGCAQLREDARLSIKVDGEPCSDISRLDLEDGSTVELAQVEERSIDGAVVVNYGINTANLTILAGKTIQQVLDSVKAILHIEGSVTPSVNGSAANWDKVVRAGDTVVFTNTNVVCEKGKAK